MLKEFIAQKEWIFPPAPSVRIIVDMIELLRRARAALEHRSRSPATTSARPARPPCRSWPSRSPTASATCRRRSTRGLDVDDFAPRLSFFFDVHNDFFEESRQVPRRAPHVGAHHARALRRARPALLAAAHARPDGGRLAHRAAAAQQRRPRHAAGAGRGARRHQSLHTNSLRRDARAADRGRRRRSRCARSRSSPRRPASTNTVDPLGGSYFVEALTDRASSGEAYELHRQDRRAWAASSAPSRRASRSRRSPTPRTATSGRSTAARRSWSA